MAILFRVLYLFVAGVIVKALPVKDLTVTEYVRSPLSELIEITPNKRDTDYVRSPLSDWDTPLPARDDGPIEPVPQQDLKH